MTDRLFSATTRAVRASIAADREHGAVVPPIHLTSTFAFEGFGKPRTFDYTRSGNPTRAQLANALAELEEGTGAVITSTGMSAVTLVVQLLSPGDTIVAAHDCYGGTQRLLRGLAKRRHFDVQFVDLSSPAGITRIAQASPRIVWVETPSNPLLRITDIQAVAEAAHRAGAIVVVDNTFLSPALQQPLRLGADIVLHSTTKYLNGHSDVVGGAVIAADPKLVEELAWWANCLGLTGAPFDSYLTLRGVRTLQARMAVHLANAEVVVDALRRHPAVTHVYYPGLADHPGHDVARRQQGGFGAMVSFEIAGGVSAVERFASRLRCFTLAESLGGVESLVAHPATMTHASMDAEARAVAGISDALVRLSVGIESADDLVHDLDTALDDVASDLALSRPRRQPARVAECGEARADVVLLGVGAIGREVLRQVGERMGAGDERLRVCGVIDRTGYVVERDGFTAARLAALRESKLAGRPLVAQGGVAAPATHALRVLEASCLERPVLVDLTSDDTSHVAEGALRAGFDLVLANKVPLAADQAAYDHLLATALRARRVILSEATVGAGLPVLDTLRKLIESGDDVISIEGCPSGTLGFLFGELGKGVPFSAALRRAVAAGYTEPDPRVDLSGTDVARKALILARAIGFRGDLTSVNVQSLVPDGVRALSRDEFLALAGEFDGLWAEHVADTRRAGKVLRYRARVTPTSIDVGLVAVDASGHLGQLDGTDNQFTFTTARYREHPLIITGPGAGPAVTAGGVLNDLLNLAQRQRAEVRGAFPAMRQAPATHNTGSARPGALVTAAG